MSRRSQRLVTSRYYPGDDDTTTSSSSTSLLGGTQLPFKETTGRTIRRKSSSTKRLSPAPSTQTSYYSESMMSESYLGGSQGLAALGSSMLDDDLDSSTYWGRELSTRRRRGTGDTESSKINGVLESKTYDTYTSSSGYSSEDDYAGHYYSGQSSSGSGLRTAASRVGSFLWQVFTSPVQFMGWLFSGLAGAWRRLTGTTSHLDSVPFSRRYPRLKRSLLLLLLLLLLAAATYGAWYFYPYGLSTLSLPSFSWWGAGKLFSSSDIPGAGDLTTLDQGGHRLLARFQSLEKRFEALEAELSRWELRRGAAAVTAGGEPPPGDILALLEGLVSRRDAGLKEHLRTDMANQLQGELDVLRAQVQRDLDGRLGKMAQASREMEARLLELNSEWQSSVQESLRGTFQQEVGKLEQEVAVLRRELASLKSDQEVMGKHVKGILEQLKTVRADVEAQFPAWISRFLSQSQQDGAAAFILQREDLQAELQALEHKILAKVLEDRRLSARDAQAGIGVALRQGGAPGVTEEQVHLIVGQALKRYSEDRVGMVDYALESAGASVINTRCSETYETRTALLSLFGIPLWYHSQSPRVILQPDVNPGNCWAFRGSQGFAVIRLSGIIRPTAVTLEHIPKALSPQGTIPSAPKDFAVYGLKEEGEEEGLLLGQFTYNHDGDPIQTFYLEGDSMGTYQLVELRVLSNWGHPEYTCIYRFRVHGEPAH